MLPVPIRWPVRPRLLNASTCLARGKRTRVAPLRHRGCGPINTILKEASYG